MKREETTKGLDSSVQIPTDRTYSLQCMEEEFKQWDSGNYGIRRKWQIIAPSVVEIDGQNVDVTGTEISQMVMTLMTVPAKGKSAEQRTKDAMGRVYKDYDILSGGKFEDEIDPSNPTLIAKGKVIDATLNNEEYTRTYPPTPEEIKAGKKQGKPIKDDDGKEMKGFKRGLGSVLGLSRVSPVPF